MKNETQILAAKLLTQILASEENQSDNSADLTKVLSKLEELSNRLDKIEISLEEKTQTPQTETANFIKPVFPVFLHPSKERFALEDETAMEKACHFEPGGKPCDHCAMCSARGF